MTDVRIARLEERVDGMRQALKLQAAEYSRRLDTLNHEAERIRQAQAVSVTAEKFDDYVTSQRAALQHADSAMNLRVEKLEDAQIRVSARQAVYAFLFGLLVSLIPVLIFLASQSK